MDQVAISDAHTSYPCLISDLKVSHEPHFRTALLLSNARGNDCDKDLKSGLKKRKQSNTVTDHDAWGHQVSWAEQRGYDVSRSEPQWDYAIKKIRLQMSLKLYGMTGPRLLPGRNKNFPTFPHQFDNASCDTSS